MKVRFFTQADYAVVTGWWQAHKFAVPPASWLSNHGLLIEQDGKPVCVGFIYRTDSALGVMEYIVSNPAEPSDVRSTALDVLLSSASVLAKGLGMQGLFMACGDKGLSDRMQNHDFKLIGTDVNNLLRVL